MLYRYLIGPAVLFALFLAGGYFSVRLRLFWLFHPIRSFRRLFGGRSSGSAFRAVSVALAGTLGVGNIAGVALALLTGGAGAVFWMVLSAFFAMAVKYAEVVLAMDTRRREGGRLVGGAPYYMGGGTLSRLFALLCALCAILEGSVLQGNAAAEAVSVALGVPPLIPGIFLFLLAAGVLSCGKKVISRLTAVIVPFATVLYLIMCLSVLFVFRERLPGAVLSIFREAFSVRAGAGGVLGYLFSDAARIGCARGLLSNEAGVGTAPTAHVTSEGTTPAQQGLFGIFEVFLDTVVLCTLTALVCLAISPGGSPDAPMAYVGAAFAALFGDSAPHLLGCAVVCFAFATVLGWAFYGTSSCEYLTGSPLLLRLYSFLFSAGILLGAAALPGMVYSAIDLLLGVMTLLNLFAVTKKADRVVTLSAEGGLIRMRRGGGRRRRCRSKEDGEARPPSPAR